ncbi:hypothetical protein P8625_10445 [Tenacibaculum tangerinum]|uniref:Uncharacterized protein n=1 Tax=Tenacibaculum tangerinum TaxID=3038772 RepID=A0ABY8KZ70_9FLAO|nr:hypothetical protein [Tenacibaculum tangerinum]WGH74514.1 hypothetical protein P8625_10445 [Tenacibaculum tangerinum]
MTKNKIVLLLFFSLMLPSYLISQNKKVIKDWEEYTFNSKYGNPITIIWSLERSHKPAKYMDNRYHYFFRFKSKTKLKGQTKPVWVGFDIAVDGLERNIEFGSTLYWEKTSSWDFWHESSNAKIEMKASKGWIGTYLKELEKVSKKDKNCAELLDKLGVYTASEIASDTYDTASFTAGFFDKDIAKFISKYSKSAAKLFKITSSKAFGVITSLLESDDMGTPMNAYENAYENARGHVFVLEKHFTDLGIINSSNTNDSKKNNTKELASEDFWNTPENSKKMTVPTEEQEKIIRSIKYSQKKLGEELKKMNSAMEGFTIESSLKNDDCRKKAMIQFHESFKYNAEVLLSIKE